MTNNQEKSSLRKIPNVGSQTEQDLIAMGYTSIASLKGKKAEDLYEEECRLRGCTIDRCQLYLYRALEYFVHTENPDREKCKWWYWKDDYFYPSPCGARCVDCAKRGCRTVPIWDRKWYCCCRKPFGFWNIWHCDGETGTCSGLPVILCLVEKL